MGYDPLSGSTRILRGPIADLQDFADAARAAGAGAERQGPVLTVGRLASGPETGFWAVAGHLKAIATFPTRKGAEAALRSCGFTARAYGWTLAPKETAS